jgi:hypothetical protein
MQGPARRLEVLGAHFNTDQQHQMQSKPAVAQLQHLLDHDNHELRARMKEFMRDPLYIPCVFMQTAGTA